MKRVEGSRMWMAVLAVSGAMLIGTVSAAGAGPGCRGPEAQRGGNCDRPGTRQELRHELRQDVRELCRDRLQHRRDLRELRRDRQELRRHLRELRQDGPEFRHNMIRMRGAQHSHRC